MKRIFTYLLAAGLLVLAAEGWRQVFHDKDRNRIKDLQSEASETLERIAEEGGSSVSPWPHDEDGRIAPWWWPFYRDPVAEADDPLGPGTNRLKVFAMAQSRLNPVWNEPETDGAREKARDWFRKHADDVASLEKVADTPGYRSCLPYEELDGAPAVAFLSEPRDGQLWTGSIVLAAKGKLALADGDVATAERCLDRIAGLAAILRLHPRDEVFASMADSWRTRLFLAGVREWPGERLDAAAREAEAARRDAPQRLRDWTMVNVLQWNYVLENPGAHSGLPVELGQVAGDESPPETIGDWSELRVAEERAALMKFAREVFRAIDRLPVGAEGKEPTPEAKTVNAELGAVRDASSGYLAQILDATAIPGFSLLWKQTRNDASDVLAAVAAERERREHAEGDSHAAPAEPGHHAESEPSESLEGRAPSRPEGGSGEAEPPPSVAPPPAP